MPCPGPALGLAAPYAVLCSATYCLQLSVVLLVWRAVFLPIPFIYARLFRRRMQSAA